MAPANLVNVTSPEQFKTVLSEDLNRISCLNFWAPWAEPCKDFNKEFESAAETNPKALFLMVRGRLSQFAPLHSRVRLGRPANPRPTPPHLEKHLGFWHLLILS